MPMSHRLLVPRRNFTPRSISGLALWYDAADASTVTVSTGVSAIADKSGNGRHGTQGVGNSQPAYTIAGRNGRNVMTFDGTNDTIAIPSFSLSQPITMFVAGSSTNANFLIDGSGTNRLALYRQAGVSWTLFSGAILNGGTSDTNWHSFRTVSNSTSSSIHVDNSLITSGNAGTQTVASGLWLGASSGTSFFLAGQIGEVLLYGGLLTAGNIANLTAYLKAKWGTP
jgi:hypothetical protein